MNVVSVKPVSISEVKEMLEKRKEGEAELGYEQKDALEYVEKFCKNTPKEAKALAEKLMKNKKLTADSVIKIVDIKPKNIETIKAILLKDKVELTEEELNDIYKELH